jgi:hypothetical protein
MIIIASYSSGSATSQNGSPYAITIPVPASQPGDLILIHLITRAADFDVVNYPSGFSLVKSYKKTTSPYLSHYLFAKIAGSSEPTSFVFNLNNYFTIAYRSIIARGVDQSQQVLSLTEYNGSGATASLNKINLQQGSLVLAFVGRTGQNSFSSSDGWFVICGDYNGSAFYQIFGGASQTENPIVFYSGDNNDNWSFWLIELKDANPIICDTIFINWLLTDEPGSRLWVKINGEWKPAKVTII